MPLYIVSKDLSPELSTQGYVASYNVPRDPFIFNISGQCKLVKKYGDFFTFDKTARAQIFARGISGVYRVYPGYIEYIRGI